jgi:hypothetical protein
MGGPYPCRQAKKYYRPHRKVYSGVLPFLLKVRGKGIFFDFYMHMSAYEHRAKN